MREKFQEIWSKLKFDSKMQNKSNLSPFFVKIFFIIILGSLTQLANDFPLKTLKILALDTLKPNDLKFSFRKFLFL